MPYLTNIGGAFEIDRGDACSGSPAKAKRTMTWCSEGNDKNRDRWTAGEMLLETGHGWPA